MGHYDSQYEAQEREDRARAARWAKTEADRRGVNVLPASKFKVIGVCTQCSEPVYSLPNWGCRQSSCPHKP